MSNDQKRSGPRLAPFDPVLADEAAILGLVPWRTADVVRRMMQRIESTHGRWHACHGHGCRRHRRCNKRSLLCVVTALPPAERRQRLMELHDALAAIQAAREREGRRVDALVKRR